MAKYRLDSTIVKRRRLAAYLPWVGLSTYLSKVLGRVRGCFRPFRTACGELLNSLLPMVEQEELFAHLRESEPCALHACA